MIDRSYSSAGRPNIANLDDTLRVVSPGGGPNPFRCGGGSPLWFFEPVVLNGLDSEAIPSCWTGVVFRNAPTQSREVRGVRGESAEGG